MIFHEADKDRYKRNKIEKKANYDLAVLWIRKKKFKKITQETDGQRGQGEMRLAEENMWNCGKETCGSHEGKIEVEKKKRSKSHRGKREKRKLIMITIVELLQNVSLLCIQIF